MKKIYILFLVAVFSFLLCSQGCNDYLNQAPESGLSEQEVFSKYENFKQFFEAVYGNDKNALNDKRYILKHAYSFYFGAWSRKYTWDGMTDIVDQGRLLAGHSIKGGQMGGAIKDYTTTAGYRPLLPAMIRVIRTANIALAKIEMLQDAAPEEVEDFIAQAYFVRAFAHFAIVRFWGDFPYIDKVIGEDDEWDIPRLPAYETLILAAKDLDLAVEHFKKAGRMRRDNPTLGAPGHLDHQDMWKPSGVSAIALKSRILLYAASPLYNKKGTEAWKAAADASWDAIKTAEQYGYFLLPLNEYTDNYVGTKYTDEHLWAYSLGSLSYGTGWHQSTICAIFTGNKGYRASSCPTQNVVDRFETKWGDPLNTSAQRTTAAKAGHYNEQNPYADRDPRFYLDIIYNQAPIPGYKVAQIYYDPTTKKYSELLDQKYRGVSHTGYYMAKFWGGQSRKNNVKPLTTDPLIRLGEIYLNYAEAANEVYGPNGKSPGASLSAVQALNKIRERVEMPAVQSQFTGSASLLRPRIKNERIIELCFEGHQYFDLRRWKDAPQAYSTPLQGVFIEKVKKSSTYPTGFKYTRANLADNRQVKWKDAMYYFPFLTSDMETMKNFTPNPTW